ncbi:hypothetical protein [Nonlabens tegetincola]|uniref:hypothetical protein n=1 Tax=Nonlabens tegetincola TaxID=323273 RepID=UPI0011B0CAEB
MKITILTQPLKVSFLYSLFFLGLCQLISAQGTLTDPFENYRSIDNTQYKHSKTLYVFDLNIKPHKDSTLAILEWRSHPNLYKYMIEMYDQPGGELIYRQIHRSKENYMPASGHFVVYPITGKLSGTPLSINLNEAKEREFEPKNTSRYLQIKKREAEQREIDKRREAKEAQLELERNSRLTPQSFLMVLYILIIAIFVTVVVLIFKNSGK